DANAAFLDGLDQLPPAAASWDSNDGFDVDLGTRQGDLTSSASGGDDRGNGTSSLGSPYNVLSVCASLLGSDKAEAIAALRMAQMNQEPATGFAHPRPKTYDINGHSAGRVHDVPGEDGQVRPGEAVVHVVGDEEEVGRDGTDQELQTNK
ncbi:unnamed protein product, partial [Amoebophrya sp. A25]